MEQTITCISCPVGCRLNVTVESGEVKEVTGQGCNRGLVYAKQESVAPRRMVTAVVKLQNRPMPLSVKTRSPIPKEMIKACMEAIEALKLSAPIQIGQVVCPNVCGTDVDVIATKTIL